MAALKRLDTQSPVLESTTSGPSLKTYTAHERARARQYGGRTTFDDSQIAN